jgi:CheY-like chemotaxis protein
MAKVKFDSILVVDDQENWRELLASLLEDEGYLVETAASFKGAKHAIMHKVFALVILDVRLVDKERFNMQGIELLRILKSQTKPPKIIVITGYAESIPEYILDEVDTFLLKVPPGATFDIGRFRKKVTTLLSESRSRR